MLVGEFYVPDFCNEGLSRQLDTNKKREQLEVAPVSPYFLWVGKGT